MRFVDAGAYMELSDGAIRLVLSTSPVNMPREVWIIVEFLPTLAVNNVTEGNVGGTVMVNGVGTASNNADGVPAIEDGIPYVMATSVYGKPDSGYRVDWDYIVIRNLNDLNGQIGEPVMVKPDANGYFKTRLQTTIAGETQIVEKTGRVTEGSIIVELDGLPVPLQIDLRFIPARGGSGTTQGDGDEDADGDSDGSGGAGTGAGGSGGAGGLPRTGVESVIVLLILGLATSLIAGVAVAIVIRRMGIKERGGVSSKSSGANSE